MPATLARTCPLCGLRFSNPPSLSCISARIPQHSRGAASFAGTSTTGSPLACARRSRGNRPRPGAQQRTLCTRGRHASGLATAGARRPRHRGDRRRRRGHRRAAVGLWPAFRRPAGWVPNRAGVAGQCGRVWTRAVLYPDRPDRAHDRLHPLPRQGPGCKLSLPLLHHRLPAPGPRPRPASAGPGAEGLGGKVEIVTFNVDPGGAGPRQLAAFLEQYGAASHPATAKPHWHFLTGSPQQIKRVVRDQYHVAYWKVAAVEQGAEGSNALAKRAHVSYDIKHSDVTYVVNHNGTIRHLFTGRNAATKTTLLNAILTILRGGSGWVTPGAVVHAERSRCGNASARLEALELGSLYARGVRVLDDRAQRSSWLGGQMCTVHGCRSGHCSRCAHEIFPNSVPKSVGTAIRAAQGFRAQSSDGPICRGAWAARFVQ